MTILRMTIPEYVMNYGGTVESVRKRAQRGTIAAEKQGGTWIILVDITDYYREILDLTADKEALKRLYDEQILKNQELQEKIESLEERIRDLVAVFDEISKKRSEFDTLDEDSLSGLDSLAMEYKERFYVSLHLIFDLAATSKKADDMLFKSHYVADNQKLFKLERDFGYRN